MQDTPGKIILLLTYYYWRSPRFFFLGWQLSNILISTLKFKKKTLKFHDLVNFVHGVVSSRTDGFDLYRKN